MVAELDWELAEAREQAAEWQQRCLEAEQRGERLMEQNDQLRKQRDAFLTSGEYLWLPCSESMVTAFSLLCCMHRGLRGLGTQISQRNRTNVPASARRRRCAGSRARRRALCTRRACAAARRCQATCSNVCKPGERHVTIIMRAKTHNVVRRLEGWLSAWRTQAAVALLYSSAPATAHMDGTTKNQRKFQTLGISLHESKADLVLNPMGVFPQATGTAAESAELTVRAMDALDEVLADLRAFLEEQGIETETFLSQLAALTLSAVKDVDAGAELAAEAAALLPLRSAAEAFTATQSDHAAAAKKLNKEFAELLAERKAHRDHDDFDAKSAAQQRRLVDAARQALDILAAFCWNHKRANVEAAFVKGEQSVLSPLLGPTPEFRGTLVDVLLHGVHKAFGHASESYEFGVGAVKFVSWMQQRYPDKWMGLKRHVGSRLDVVFENAFVVFVMRKYYLEYLLEKPVLNKLDAKLVSALATGEVEAALLARALFWLLFFQPLREATKSEKVGSKFADMQTFAVEGQKALQGIAADAKLVFSRDYKPFANAKVSTEVDKYRSHLSDAIDAVFGEAALLSTPLMAQLVRVRPEKMERVLSGPAPRGLLL